MKLPANSPSWTHSPAMSLGTLLGVSIVLALLPPSKTQPLREAWREALRPGQQVLATGGEWAKAARDQWRGGDGDSSNHAPQQVAELAEQVRRLELELLIERSQHQSVRASPSDAIASPGGQVELAGYVTPIDPSPLLISQSIPARVLGRQAKAFLVDRDILDVGRRQGTRRESLVVDAAESLDAISVVDQGRSADVQPNRLVLAGRRVWGRIADVGPQTSTVRRMNDLGYRDLVQLASPHEGRLHFSARGMLVGSGQRLCKIELVETTQPVTVGDLVFTADDGVLDSPLLYGRVAKLERKPGAAHWEIWMEPAVGLGNPPSHVAVLRMEINPVRTQ